VKIKIFSVGGTIDKVYFDSLSSYQVGAPSVREILDGLPVAFEYEIESLLRKDSLDMDDSDRRLVRQAIAGQPCRRVLVTHGTDTMIETGKVLGGIPGKCIVLTGAMEPAHFKSSDAVFNVGVAIGALCSLPDGVFIAMNGRIFDPHTCRKNRERHLFEQAPPSEEHATVLDRKSTPRPDLPEKEAK
jgi:L-asparaginase